MPVSISNHSIDHDSTHDEWIHTCTIITGEPNEFVREIHARMPIILPEEHHDSWLSGEAGKEILVPYPADRMKVMAYQCSCKCPKSNDAKIVVRIEIEAPESVFWAAFFRMKRRSVAFV
jgi:putative SOS response-associated peptidase YedK